MKFTLNWLKEYLDTKADLEEIAECLTKIGLEVESIDDKAAQLKDFNVVEVLKIEKHPHADRLNLCTVKTLTEEFQLICGANNLYNNMKAILAPLGSVIPANQMKVKKVKIRGIESVGMLCSAKELGIGEDHDGIIEIAKTAKIGENIAKILKIDDPIIEVAITPNRGDCLGVYGIARDLAAAGMGRLKKINIVKDKADFDSEIKLQVTDNNCKDFNVVEIKGIKNTPSPNWLRNKIEAIGIKSKSAIVDITNYVLYCFGQPLHAYDKRHVTGNFIIVEKTNSEQKFLALDDIEYNLPKESLVIKDQTQLLSLAGIIGGKLSSCTNDTTDIILEAANFSDQPVSFLGRKLQIDTDSRYRFERKIDPLFVTQALLYAASLIKEVCGGKISNMVKMTSKPYKAKIIELNIAQLYQIAADKIPLSEISTIFTKLGLKILTKNEKIITVEIPSWRNDLTISEDLIEEILRLRDFNKIPYVKFQNNLKKESNYLDMDKDFSIKRLLGSLGLNEVITWSFYSKNDAEIYNLSEDLQIKNPISKDLSILRASLVPNLVNIALQNQNKGNDTSEIFEYGTIFLNYADEAVEKNTIAGLRIGPRHNKEINNSNQSYDIFDVKDDIFTVLEFLNISEQRINIIQEDLPSFMHPKRSARLSMAKKDIGYFGEIHPAIAKKLAIRQRINVFEVVLSNIPNITGKQKKYRNLELQPVNRDFCFIVSEDILAGDIKKEIFKTDASLITEVKIFDLYRGENLTAGKKSLAFNVKLQPVNSSLTGEELELFSNKVINNISKKFAATLPG